MPTYIFELEGCTPANLMGVQGSLVNTPGASVYRTARGSYVLKVEATASPESQLAAILASIGVRPIPATEVASISIARNSTIR